MNASYATFLPYRPPVTEQMRRDALEAMTRSAPMPQYGSQFGDLMRSEGMANYGSYRKAADKANFQYGAARQEGERALALGGLQGMVADADRQRQLQSARLGNMRSALAALL